MRFLLRILVYAAAVWIAVVLIDGLNFEGEPLGYLGVAVVMAGVNAIIKPVVRLLSLPFIVLTLGLFLLAVNTFLFWLVIAISDQLDFGLSSEGLGDTFLGALAVSVVVWAGERLFARER